MSFPMKVVTYDGLATLSEFIKQVKKTSDGNTSDVTSLQHDLQELASQLAAVLTEVGDCIETLDTSKAYIAVRKDFSLAADGWVEDTDEDSFEYAYKYVLEVSGVTAEARADAVLDNLSATMAGEYGMAPVTETVENGVVFRCRTIPEDALSGQLYITQGAAESTTT